MKTKEFLVRVFTWWNGATLGTLLWTARFGELVGTDDRGALRNRHRAELLSTHFNRTAHVDV
jgi:hypothetical protein